VGVEVTETLEPTRADILGQGVSSRKEIELPVVVDCQTWLLLRFRQREDNENSFESAFTVWSSSTAHSFQSPENQTIRRDEQTGLGSLRFISATLRAGQSFLHARASL
jgi:hypothetical protein